MATVLKSEPFGDSNELVELLVDAGDLTTVTIVVQAYLVSRDDWGQTLDRLVAQQLRHEKGR